MKKPWESKTVWTALILAVVAFIPGVQSWIKDNSTIFSELVAGVFFILRMISHGKINISDDDSNGDIAQAVAKP